MKASMSKPNEVWYVDSGVSNHMTSHKEWFSYLEKPEQPGVTPLSNTVSITLSFGNRHKVTVDRGALRSTQNLLQMERS